MKKYLIIVFLISICFIISKCTGIPERNNTAGVESKDTLVGEFSYPHSVFNARKFYLIVDGDTSDFYCVLESVDYSGELRLEIFNDPKHRKVEFRIRDNADDGEDESLVPDTLTSEEQIQELKYILGHISKKYDLRDLGFIKFDVFSITGLTSQIGETIIEQNIGFDYKNILAAIDVTVKKSSFITNLNTIVRLYGIGMDSMFVWDNKYLSGNLDILKEIKRAEKSKLRDSLLGQIPISAFIVVRFRKL